MPISQAFKFRNENIYNQNIEEEKSEDSQEESEE
tara:strand:- start:387 stop:488 length:102 start_codon:yes stop_codon:yes gene_type:complete